MNNPSPSAELHYLVDTALARGCDVIITIARDGQHHSIRVRNRQTIEIVETVGEELEAA